MIERDWSKLGLIAIILVALGGAIYQGLEEGGGGHSGNLLKAGTPAPELKGEKFGGGSLALSSLKGQVVMLDFWATWCGPCRAEMPDLLKLAHEYESKGLTFVAVNRDDPDTAKVEVGMYVTDALPGLGRHILFPDQGTAAAYRVEALPTLYFIDREGRVTQAEASSQSEAKLRQKIEAALASGR